MGEIKVSRPQIPEALPPLQKGDRADATVRKTDHAASEQLTSLDLKKHIEALLPIETTRLAVDITDEALLKTIEEVDALKNRISAMHMTTPHPIDPTSKMPLESLDTGRLYTRVFTTATEHDLVDLEAAGLELSLRANAHRERAQIDQQKCSAIDQVYKLEVGIAVEGKDSLGKAGLSGASFVIHLRELLFTGITWLKFKCLFLRFQSLFTDNLKTIGQYEDAIKILEAQGKTRLGDCHRALSDSAEKHTASAASWNQYVQSLKELTANLQTHQETMQTFLKQTDLGLLGPFLFTWGKLTAFAGQKGNIIPGDLAENFNATERLIKNLEETIKRPTEGLAKYSTDPALIARENAIKAVIEDVKKLRTLCQDKVALCYVEQLKPLEEQQQEVVQSVAAQLTADYTHDIQKELSELTGQPTPIDQLTRDITSLQRAFKPFFAEGSTTPADVLALERNPFLEFLDKLDQFNQGKCNRDAIIALSEQTNKMQRLIPKEVAEEIQAHCATELGRLAKEKFAAEIPPHAPRAVQQRWTENLLSSSKEAAASYKTAYQTFEQCVADVKSEEAALLGLIQEKPSHPLDPEVAYTATWDTFENTQPPKFNTENAGPSVQGLTMPEELGIAGALTKALLEVTQLGERLKKEAGTLERLLKQAATNIEPLSQQKQTVQNLITDWQKAKQKIKTIEAHKGRVESAWAKLTEAQNTLRYHHSSSTMAQSLRPLATVYASLVAFSQPPEPSLEQIMATAQQLPELQKTVEELKPGTRPQGEWKSVWAGLDPSAKKIEQAQALVHQETKALLDTCKARITTLYTSLVKEAETLLTQPTPDLQQLTDTRDKLKAIYTLSQSVGRSTKPTVMLELNQHIAFLAWGQLAQTPSAMSQKDLDDLQTDIKSLQAEIEKKRQSSNPIQADSSRLEVLQEIHRKMLDWRNAEGQQAIAILNKSLENTSKQLEPAKDALATQQKTVAMQLDTVLDLLRPHQKIYGPLQEFRDIQTAKTLQLAAQEKTLLQNEGFKAACAHLQYPIANLSPEKFDDMLENILDSLISTLKLNKHALDAALKELQPYKAIYSQLEDIKLAKARQLAEQKEVLFKDPAFIACCTKYNYRNINTLTPEKFDDMLEKILDSLKQKLKEVTTQILPSPDQMMYSKIKYLRVEKQQQFVNQTKTLFENQTFKDICAKFNDNKTEIHDLSSKEFNDRLKKIHDYMPEYMLDSFVRSLVLDLNKALDNSVPLKADKFANLNDLIELRKNQKAPFVEKKTALLNNADFKTVCDLLRYDHKKFNDEIDSLALLLDFDEYAFVQQVREGLQGSTEELLTLWNENSALWAGLTQLDPWNALYENLHAAGILQKQLNTVDDIANAQKTLRAEKALLEFMPQFSQNMEQLLRVADEISQTIKDSSEAGKARHETKVAARDRILNNITSHLPEDARAEVTGAITRPSSPERFNDAVNTIYSSLEDSFREALAHAAKIQKSSSQQ